MNILHIVAAVLVAIVIAHSIILAIDYAMGRSTNWRLLGGTTARAVVILSVMFAVLFALKALFNG